MVKIYFAHPITDYGTRFEKITVEKIVDRTGFTVVNPNTPEHDAGYRLSGMDYFKDVVDGCDALIFTTFPNGKIGAGVAQEIKWAMLAGKPVYEFNRFSHNISNNLTNVFGYMIMSVDETKACIKELKARERNPKSLTFTYRNWNGDTRQRTAVPISIWYGTSEWHKDMGDQWFLEAIDEDTDSPRHFLMKDICDYTHAPIFS